MFVHTGFRPLWPAIFLLPWFIFGITCLFEPLLHRRESASRRLGRRRTRSARDHLPLGQPDR
jgi:hypothetical protein